MAKPKNKSLQIKQLESQLEDARKSLDLMAKKYNDLSEQVSNGVSAGTRKQLEDQIEFYKNLAELNEKLLIESKVFRQKKILDAHLVAADNQKLLKEHGIEYFAGITQEQHSEPAYDNLRKIIFQTRAELDVEKAKNKFLAEQLRDKWKSTDKNAQSIANDIKKKRVYRPSGRPPKVDDDTTALILELRKNDCTMREIAKEVSLSVGTIHRIISENSEKMV